MPDSWKLVPDVLTCSTNYVFKACYYDSGEKVHISKNMNIIHSFEYISHLDASKLDSQLAGLFTDKRIKDLLVIKIDDSIIDNFINKKFHKMDMFS